MPAVGLRLVKREIGVGDELVDRCAVLRRDRDAGAAADMQQVLIDLERLRQLLQHRFDELGDPARIAAVGNDDDELVAAEPVHPAGCPPATRFRRRPPPPAARRRSNDQSVSLTSLKPSRSNSAIECERPSGVRGQQLRQLALQRDPVRQPGQLVIMRDLAQLPLGLLAAGDVLVGPRHAPAPCRRDCTSAWRPA